MVRNIFVGVAAAALISAAADAATAPKVVWSAAVNQQVFSTPQGGDGNIYLTSTQATGPNLFAIDGQTGKQLWSYATQGQIAIPPTVGKTQVFVASDIGSTHFLRAINAQNGDLIWQYTRDQPPECMCSQASILTGGLLFAQSDGHSLYAFLPSGAAPTKRIWQFPGDGAPLSSPVVSDGFVVFGSADHNVYALDAKNGKVRWSNTAGYVFTASPLVVDGVVVIGDQGGNISGFDLKTGKSLWNFSAGNVDVAAIAKGDNAYLVTEDHSIYALNIQTGSQVWQYTMADYAQFSPVLVGDLIVAANRAGALVAVDANSGKLAWQTGLDGTPFSQPVYFPAEHAIVLKIGDQSIGAFDARTGKRRWLYNGSLVVTPPVIDGDEIAFVTSTGQVKALR